MHVRTVFSTFPNGYADFRPDARIVFTTSRAQGCEVMYLLIELLIIICTKHASHENLLQIKMPDLQEGRGLGT